MFQTQHAKQEKDYANGKRTKDGIKDGDLLNKAKVSLFKVFSTIYALILHSKKKKVVLRLFNGIRLTD